jgi:hypothetical protein
MRKYTLESREFTEQSFIPAAPLVPLSALFPWACSIAYGTAPQRLNPFQSSLRAMFNWLHRESIIDCYTCLSRIIGGLGVAPFISQVCIWRIHIPTP